MIRAGLSYYQVTYPMPRIEDLHIRILAFLHAEFLR